jgi:hypothetical protein
VYVDTQDAWDTVRTLSDILPAWARPWALLAGLVVLGSSHIALLLHSALTMLGPGENWGRTALARTAGVFDFLGVNAKTVIAVASRAIGLLKKRPAALVLTLGVLMSSSSACASTPLRTQAIALEAAADVIKDVQGIMQREFDADMVHETNGLTGAAFADAVHVVLVRWAPIRAAYVVVKSFKDSYESELKAARSSGGTSVSALTVANLIAAGEKLRQEAVKIHLDEAALKLAKGIIQ